MTHPILEKYKALKPLSEDAATNSMLAVLVEIPRSRLFDYFGVSPRSGRFYMLRHEAFPGKVLEYVPDNVPDTSVSTLYADHPIFESRQTLIEARDEIIRAIDELLLSVPGTVTVLDEGRGKEFHLYELGTAQLIDVLTHFYQPKHVLAA